MASLKKIPIGLQLWSLRDDCAKDLPDTLRYVKEIGYDGVELAGTHNRSGAEWARMLKDLGLLPLGAHVGLASFSPENLPATLELYGAIGCRRLTVPALPKELQADIAGFERAADLINAAVAPCRAAGFELGYHNHAFEFQPIGGQVPYDALVARFRPEVKLQFDLGWVHFAGADAIALLKKYPDRSPLVHVKAWSAKNETAVLGEDDVDWPKVLDVCVKTGGTEAFIVEHERYANPPRVCVKQCLDYLRGIGR